MKVRNTFIIFIVSGFWHGANWTFIVWGTLNAIYFLPLLLLDKNRNNLGVVAENSWFPSFRELFSMLTTFSLTMLAWIFFRAENIGHAFNYIGGIFKASLLEIPEVINLKMVALILFFIFIEWLGRTWEYALEKINLKYHIFIRWTFYSFIIFLIGIFMQTEEIPFIYFQF
jgi:D-alanyl-lipoteichoic acid acyltransferase DltB (MBOAT superfamily)